MYMYSIPSTYKPMYLPRYITPSNPFHLDLIKHYWQS